MRSCSFQARLLESVVHHNIESMPVKDVCLEMNRGLPESELYGTEETQSILSEMATQNQIMVTTTGTAQHGTRLFASISLIFLIVVKAWSIFCSSSTSKLVGSRPPKIWSML